MVPFTPPAMRDDIMEMLRQEKQESRQQYEFESSPINTIDLGNFIQDLDGVVVDIYQTKESLLESRKIKLNIRSFGNEKKSPEQILKYKYFKTWFDGVPLSVVSDIDSMDGQVAPYLNYERLFSEINLEFNKRFSKIEEYEKKKADIQKGADSMTAKQLQEAKNKIDSLDLNKEIDADELDGVDLEKKYAELEDRKKVIMPRIKAIRIFGKSEELDKLQDELSGIEKMMNVIDDKIYGKSK